MNTSFVFPVIAGSGLPLFKNIGDKSTLTLINTKIFNGGAVILYYKPAGKNGKPERRYPDKP